MIPYDSVLQAPVLRGNERNVRMRTSKEEHDEDDIEVIVFSSSSFNQIQKNMHIFLNNMKHFVFAFKVVVLYMRTRGHGKKT